MNTHDQSSGTEGAAVVNTSRGSFAMPEEIKDAIKAYKDASKNTTSEIYRILGIGKMSLYADQEFVTLREHDGREKLFIYWVIKPTNNYFKITEILLEAPETITETLLESLRGECGWRKMVNEWYRGITIDGETEKNREMANESHLTFFNILQTAFGQLENAYIGHHSEKKMWRIDYAIDQEIRNARRVLGMTVNY